MIGTPIFIATVLDILTGSHYTSGVSWIGLLVPPALILHGTVFPKIGWWVGIADRQFILEHVQSALAARIEEPSPFSSEIGTRELT